MVYGQFYREAMNGRWGPVESELSPKTTTNIEDTPEGRVVIGILVGLLAIPFSSGLPPLLAAKACIAIGAGTYKVMKNLDEGKDPTIIAVAPGIQQISEGVISFVKDRQT